MCASESATATCQYVELQNDYNESENTIVVATHFIFYLTYKIY